MMKRVRRLERQHVPPDEPMEIRIIRRIVQPSPHGPVEVGRRVRVAQVTPTPYSDETKKPPDSGQSCPAANRKR
jgi:hypothetical protein